MGEVLLAEGSMEYLAYAIHERYDVDSSVALRRLDELVAGSDAT